MESVGDIATVTVHIKKIREKLSIIMPSRSISRPSGAWDTDLKCDNF